MCQIKLLSSKLKCKTDASFQIITKTLFIHNKFYPEIPTYVRGKFAQKLSYL